MSRRGKKQCRVCGGTFFVDRKRSWWETLLFRPSRECSDCKEVAIAKEKSKTYTKRCGMPIEFVPFPKFWQCPKCYQILEKGMGGMSHGSAYRSVEGSATCGGCGAQYEQQYVYLGWYDVSEIKMTCPRCKAALDGPLHKLLGQPCPACGVKIPGIKND